LAREIKAKADNRVRSTCSHAWVRDNYCRVGFVGLRTTRQKDQATARVDRFYPMRQPGIETGPLRWQVLVDTRTHGARHPPYRHSPTRMLTVRLAFLACANIQPRRCGQCCFGCSVCAEVQLEQAFRARPHWPPQQQSISVLVVEDSVAIDVSRVRCPAGAE
jgi:hypothetical protein